MSADPRAVYSQLLDQRRAETAAREQRHRLLAYARLASVVCALAVVWLALDRKAFSVLWVLVPAAGFAPLIVIHEHLLRLMERRRRAPRVFGKGLGRAGGERIGARGD